MPPSAGVPVMDAQERQEKSVEEYQNLASSSNEKLSLLALRSGDLLAIRQADEASVGADPASRRPWSTLRDSSGLDDWACCDRCNKWRRVPKAVVEKLTSTSKWFCSQNADWLRASCDDPEEEYDGPSENSDDDLEGGTAATHPHSNKLKWVRLLEEAFQICHNVSLTRNYKHAIIWLFTNTFIAHNLLNYFPLKSQPVTPSVEVSTCTCIAIRASIEPSVGQSGCPTSSEL